MRGKSASRKSLMVSESLKRLVKVRAAELGRTVQSVVDEALTAWLNERAVAAVTMTYQAPPHE